MKKKVPGNYIPFIIMAVIFVLLTSLALMFLESQRNKSRLLLEHEIERTVFSIVEALRNLQERGQKLSPVFDDEIRGFGLYLGTGNPVVRYGSAPERIVNPDLLKPRFHRNTKMNTIRYIGPIFRTTDFQHRMMPGMRKMGQPPAMMNQLVYVEMSMDDYFSRQRLYTAGFFLVPLAFGAAAVYSTFLIRKNRDYRNRIAAQERLVQLGEAARTLAHEIKNPLSAIRIRTGILKKTIPDTAQEDVVVIEEETKRLSQLVDRVRDFLKTPKGEPEVLNPEVFIKDIIHRYSSRVDYKGDNTGKTGRGEEKVAGDTEIGVFIDTLRFHSVIENLINNGLESYPTDIPDEEKEIILFLEIESEKCTITIRDYGKGIKKEEKEKLFDPFFTTKTTGSGIGLAVSRRFIEAAGGSLDLHANSLGGTDAVIVLPIVDKGRNKNRGGDSSSNFGS